MTTPTGPITISSDARLGAVFINGVPSTEITGCIVDRTHGIVTFGSWEKALESYDYAVKLRKGLV